MSLQIKADFSVSVSTKVVNFDTVLGYAKVGKVNRF